MIPIAGSLLILCTASAHAQGGVPLWTNRYDSPNNGNDEPTRGRAIAVDRSGNVFVTGSSRPAGSSHHDYATIAYSANGTLLWAHHYNGPSNRDDVPYGIAVDPSGNVFVTGASIGIGGAGDYATLAYSNSGVPLWTNRFEGTENSDDGALAIAVDGEGNVFVTGCSHRTTMDGFRGCATIKYSNAGVPLWTNLFVGDWGSGNFRIPMALDGSGNVCVVLGTVGTFKYSTAGALLWTNDLVGDIALDGTGSMFLTTGFGTPNGLGDMGIIKCSSTGVPVWTNRYNGPGNGEDRAVALAVDSGDNVIVTGYSTGNGTYWDYVTINYSNTGVPLWTRRYNGPANDGDEASAIAVDTAGNVFVTGNSWNGSNRDFVTVAYSGAGMPLWTNRYNALADDEPYALAADLRGNVVVAGRSWNGSNNDYVIIKYSSSVPPPRLDFQLLNNQLVLSWTNAGFSLQSAPAVTGPFTNLSAATSPYTNPLTAPQQFFRLNSN